MSNAQPFLISPNSEKLPLEKQELLNEWNTLQEQLAKFVGGGIHIDDSATTH